MQEIHTYKLISRLVPGGQAGLIDVFVTALLGIAGVFAATAGIQAVLRMPLISGLIFALAEHESAGNASACARCRPWK